DEGPHGQPRAHLEELDGLRGGGVGGGGGQVAQLFAHEQVGPLAVEHQHLGRGQDGGVGDGIQGADEHRRVIADDAQLNGGLALGDVAGVGGDGAAAVDLAPAFTDAGDQVVDRTQRGGEVGDVQR